MAIAAGSEPAAATATLAPGRLPERTNGAASKAVEEHRFSEGSNPSPSAKSDGLGPGVSQRVLRRPPLGSPSTRFPPGRQISSSSPSAHALDLPEVMTVDLADTGVFENPDPRGPCGGVVPAITFGTKASLSGPSRCPKPGSVSWSRRQPGQLDSILRSTTVLRVPAYTRECSGEGAWGSAPFRRVTPLQ